MSQSDDQKPQEPTAEEAAQRIGELRWVYDQGYLTRDKFETMKYDLETRVKSRLRRRRSRPMDG